MWFNALCDFLRNYFGIFGIPLIFVIILDIFFSFIKEKGKRARFKVRLFFSLVFVVAVTTAFVLGRLSYVSELSEVNIIETSLMTYNLGFFMTYFLTIITNNFKLQHIFICCGVLIFISLFFLLGKEVRKILGYFAERRNKKKAMKLEKALLEQMEAQIAMNEDLEKKRAKEYEMQNIILEETIKEKVEIALEEKVLPLENENQEEEIKETEEKKGEL